MSVRFVNRPELLMDKMTVRVTETLKSLSQRGADLPLKRCRVATETRRKIVISI